MSSIKKARVKETHAGSVKINGVLYTKKSPPFDLAADDPAWESDVIEEASERKAEKETVKKTVKKVSPKPKAKTGKRGRPKKAK